MKITFLGTGTSQGIPVINSNHPVCFSKDKRDKRLRVSILVEWEHFTYVVDCGPDFRFQMLRANVSKIDGILFTHEHADHTAGLDDMRPFSFQMGAVPIYAQKRVLTYLATRFDYIFNENNKYPGAPSVLQNEITDVPFSIGNIEIIPINVIHGNLSILGYRFDKFAYLTDVKTISNAEIDKLKNLDVLVLSCIRHKPHRSHLNLEEALDMIKKISPKKAYLTHISQYMGFHQEVEQTLPENVFLAYDELVLNL